MDTDDLRKYMFARIPLSRAMGVEIVAATSAKVTLSAPLAPNVNHQGTVFGGSASAVALLSAWALLHLRLVDTGINAAIVVKKYGMKYERPMIADFTATARVDTADWPPFLDSLRRRGRARIPVLATLRCGGDQVGELDGEFVAMTRA